MSKVLIAPNGDLKITITCREQRELRRFKKENPDTFGSDEFMTNYLDDILAREDYQWIGAEEIGALTSAPLLTKDDDVWGFMNYQIRSPQSDLLESRECEFQKG